MPACPVPNAPASSMARLLLAVRLSIVTWRWIHHRAAALAVPPQQAHSELHSRQIVKDHA